MPDTTPFHQPTDAKNSNNRFDVVIAGGGFAGLTLARALSGGLGPDARIALVRRDAARSSAADGPDSRATALSAASVRMLDRLGVWPSCEAHAQPVTAIDITDSSLRAGIRPVLLSYDNILGGSEPASRIIANQALEAALAVAVAACPNVTIIEPASIAAFEARDDAMAMTLSDGVALQAKALIAADGRRSALRERAGIKTIGWPYAQAGITVRVRHDQPHGGRAVQHFLPGGPFAILPLPGGHTSCITWSEELNEARRLMALDDTAFIDELERRAGGRLGAITLDGPRQSWPLEMFIARAFAAPRFALVGDAAHNVHPIAGQGLNLGLRDCAALCEVLVDAHRAGLDLADGSTLERYERWRRFDTMAAAASFDALNRLFSTEGTLRRAAREVGLGLVNRLPGLKQRLVEQAAGVAGDLPRLLRGEAL